MWRRAGFGGGGRGRGGFGGGGQASSNWRYLTEADRVGPRKDEMMMSTMYAKEQFGLLTSDIALIQGFRRPGSYSTQTMYYEADLKAYAIRKLGQDRYSQETKYGREESGVAQQERDKAAAEQERRADAEDEQKRKEEEEAARRQHEEIEAMKKAEIERAAALVQAQNDEWAAEFYQPSALDREPTSEDIAKLQEMKMDLAASLASLTSLRIRLLCLMEKRIMMCFMDVLKDLNRAKVVVVVCPRMR